MMRLQKLIDSFKRKIRSPVHFRDDRQGRVWYLSKPPIFVLPFAEQSEGLPQLDGPIEAEVSLNNNCSKGCTGCFRNSLPQDAAMLPLQRKKAVLRDLKRRKVFALAFSGGEVLEDPDFPELIAESKRLGFASISVTTGRTRGIECLEAVDAVHFSIDDLDSFSAARKRQDLNELRAAVGYLRDRGVEVGLNTLVTTKNFDRLEELFRFAAELRIKNIKLLRLKPTGRAKDLYFRWKLTTEQGRSLFAKATSLARKSKICLSWDCAFAPFLFASRPNPKLVKQSALAGCVGGDIGISVDQSGRMNPCGFWTDEGISLDAPGLLSEASFQAYSAFGVEAQQEELCASCPYVAHCRGGCRAIARFYRENTGYRQRADPECPMIVAQFPETIVYH